jgi:hypothetical protein
MSSVEVSDEVKTLAAAMADNSPDNPYAPMPKPLLASKDGNFLYYDFDDGVYRIDLRTQAWEKATVGHLYADQHDGAPARI